MTQKVMSNSLVKDIYSWNDFVQNKLSVQFESLVEEDGLFWFKIGNNAFRVVPFEAPFCGFIVEYSEGQDKSSLMFAEDVDQYPIEDFDSPELLLNQILADISE